MVSAVLALAACGAGEKPETSPQSKDDQATPSTKPTLPTTPGLPTNAAIDAYCAAFRGDGIDMTGVDTTGEAADEFERMLDNQRKTGTPGDMPAETRRVFIAHMQNGADFIAALRKIPEDSPISAMRTDKEFFEAWGGKLETPEELRDFSAKNC
jgi:hypothetical protein